MYMLKLYILIKRKVKEENKTLKYARVKSIDHSSTWITDIQRFIKINTSYICIQFEKFYSKYVKRLLVGLNKMSNIPEKYFKCE